ncbi:MAG TPA: outer membrane lipoprotein chaperone LolA [Thiotrichaceae bacterium]|jgi:outer membrane lipoprotein carrier protein|nr:outer membrane lipoprotein chaperone LolA [Thiotrichaceae bacterium]
MKFKLTALFLFVVFQASSVFAVDSSDPLQEFLSDFKSLQANFSQSLINENGEELERTEGILYMQQPGKFYWLYETPYTQKIISNGEVLWVFDEDLEQLTIREMGDALEQSPAGIILGNSDITEHFILVHMGVIEDHDWIELTPKNTEEAQYNNIRLGFEETILSMMIINDNLGQTTRIDFSDVKKNTELSSTLFEFEIPEGVDVIDERLIDIN